MNTFDIQPVPWRFEHGASFQPEWSEAEWGGTVVGRATSPPVPTFVLARAIPDDPDYRKHVPLEYKLNAKKIVGELAQDLQKGKSAHFWVDLVHWGIVAAEVFEFAGALAIASPVLGLVLAGMALGAPYMEAAEQIAADWAARGFSRGVVMGADKRSARLLKDYFGNDFVPRNPAFERGRQIASANYRLGLLAGYVQGRALSQNRRTIFWRDLGRRMGDQSYRGPNKSWGRRQWIDWYADAAAAFRRHHLS